MSVTSLPKKFRNAPSESYWFESIVLDRSNVIDRVIDAIARESMFPETILLYAADNAVLVANVKDEDIQVIISSTKSNKIRVAARYFIGRHHTPVHQVFDSVDEVTTDAVRYLVWKARMLTKIKVREKCFPKVTHFLISRNSEDLSTLDGVQRNVVSSIWDTMPDVNDLFIIEKNHPNGSSTEVHGWGIFCNWVDDFNYVYVKIEKIRCQGVHGYVDGENESSIRSTLVKVSESATELGEEYTPDWKYVDNAPSSTARKVADLLLSPFQRSK